MQDYSSLNVYSKNITNDDIAYINAFLKRPVFEQAKVAIMPDYENYGDVIVGLSACVDKKNIDKIPANIIGNDIGCGVLVVKTNTKIHDADLNKIDNYIKFFLFSQHNKQPLSKELEKRVSYLKPLLGEETFNEIIDSFSTLGGGNHFIELDSDKEDDLYLTIHSGSRKLGHALCKLYTELQNLNNQNVSYSLPDIDAESIANKFAKENKLAIATNLLRNFNIEILEEMDCPHSFISKDYTIHKGSIDGKKAKML